MEVAIPSPLAAKVSTWPPSAVSTVNSCPAAAGGGAKNHRKSVSALAAGAGSGRHVQVMMVPTCSRPSRASLATLPTGGWCQRSTQVGLNEHTCRGKVVDDYRASDQHLRSISGERHSQFLWTTVAALAVIANTTRK